MSTATGQALSNAGLTILSEDEELFRASVREFAEGEVRPRVEAMERASKLDPDLIKQCFDLGLMAVDVETMRLVMSPSLKGTGYESYRGKRIRIPKHSGSQPSHDALEAHCRECGLGK